MICHNCGKKFYVKRGFLQLFETKKYYVCNQCLNAFNFHPFVERIALENYNLVSISLYSNKTYTNLVSFSEQIAYLVERISKNHPDYFLVYEDEIRLTDEMIELLSFLADSVQQNILLICCRLKN